MCRRSAASWTPACLLPATRCAAVSVQPEGCSWARRARFADAPCRSWLRRCSSACWTAGRSTAACCSTCQPTASSCSHTAAWRAGCCQTGARMARRAWLGACIARTHAHAYTTSSCAALCVLAALACVPHAGMWSPPQSKGCLARRGTRTWTSQRRHSRCERRVHVPGHGQDSLSASGEFVTAVSHQAFAPPCLQVLGRVQEGRWHGLVERAAAGELWQSPALAGACRRRVRPAD